MHIENFTKPLYQFPGSTFCIFLQFCYLKLIGIQPMKVILLVYTQGLYISKGEDRVMVLNIENLTKPLYHFTRNTFFSL